MQHMGGHGTARHGASRKVLRSRWFIGVAAGLVGVAVGAGGGGTGAQGTSAVPEPRTVVSTAPGATVTTTATATATTTVTATPEPAPVVTVTATETSVVTETVTAAPQGLVDTNQGGAGERKQRDSDVHYASCKEAKAAGAAPLYRGQPGYRSKLDGDNDGVACER
ncbi:MAG: excalibur calcium-binding domain-containing protein [Arachnia propionica]|uniref:excalibur calcium-binding domain-containing protein n=1 Tax=Arachnia propionica TaxID=1750 RepID=UPI0027060976|nr:excalibur calcium-binding domain-containing protein [Arachnia propionica]